MRNTIFAFLFSGLMLSACGGREKSADFPKSVMTVKPEVFDGIIARSLSGEVKEAGEVSVSFIIAGKISGIYVKEGDRVKEGQLLAKLDDQDYRLAVQAVEPQYEQLKDEISRMEVLHERGNISENDYRKARTGLKQLEAQLQVNRNKLEYTNLYAPRSGFVKDVNFEAGEIVNAGTPVFALLDVSSVEVEASIPSSVYNNLNKVRSFTGRVNVDGGSEFPLMLVSVSPKTDANQLYKARFRIASAAEPRITPGLNVDVRFDMDMAEEPGKTAMTVPVNALFSKDGKSYVWVLSSGNTVKSQEVELSGGISGTGRVIIASGLNGDENIVKAGVQQLYEGQSVVVVNNLPESNIGGLL